MGYESPLERAYLETLGRIADALEGIRFNLTTNLASLSAENRQLQSSNNALADTLRRQNTPAKDFPSTLSVDEYLQAAHSSFILPVASTPRQVLNDTENGVADQSQQNGYEAQHIDNPDANS